ncbi:MAG: enoyl-CoA hydratase/isomerase family protein [Emcibacter sp.]|nr:enoyl-CoA hydratase/isomerase family protein [Emcibacter sp.]
MTDQVIFDTMSYHRQDNGVVFIVIDVKDRSVNVLTPEMHVDFGRVADYLAQDDKAIGAVIHSAKSSFIVGGDLNRIVRYYDQGRTAKEAYEQSRTYTQSLRKLETCGKPVAVAINGTALGGGFELALACHYRVVVDNPKLLLGLPEISLGLLPGGGGTQRLPRLIGLEKAASLILSSRYINPHEALEMGIVDAVTPLDSLLETAEKWILEKGISTQPWDRRGFKILGGSGLNQMSIAQLFQKLTLQVSIDFKYNYPSPIAALRCLFNGTTVSDMDTALRIETKEFSALTRNPVARNMIRTLFLNKGAADKPSQEDPSSRPTVKTIGLIGTAPYQKLLGDICAKEGITLVTQDINADVDMLIIARENQQNLMSTSVPHDMPNDRIIGLYISDPIDKVKAVEIIKNDNTSAETVARIKSLCQRMRKTPTVQNKDCEPFSLMLDSAYNKEAERLVGMGISPILIENAAIAAGMSAGPLLSVSNNAVLTSFEKHAMSVDDVKNCLLCAQVYAAFVALEKGLIGSVDADLISLLVNGFPSYTGGVMSFIDTIGLSAFIQMLDKLYGENYHHQPAYIMMQKMAHQSNRIYPMMT